MSKGLKRLFIVLSALALIAGAAAIFLPRISKKAKNVVITQINNATTVPINVSDIRFSFFRNFPNVSVVFLDVETKGKVFYENQKSLFKADAVAFKFNLIKILKKQYDINSIDLKNAEANIIINENKEENFNIFKSEQKTDKPFHADLKFIKLKNVLINYDDKFGGNNVSLDVTNSLCNVKLKQKEQVYKINGKSKLDIYKINKQARNISFSEFSFDILANNNKESKQYLFENCKLKFDNLNFDLNGFYNYLQDVCELNINGNFNKFNTLQLVNEKQKTSPKSNSFTINGDVDCNINIKNAKASKSNNTDVKIKLITKALKIKNNKTKYELSDLNSILYYVKPPKANAVLKVDNFVMKYKNSVLNANFQFVPKTNHVSLKIVSKIEMSDVSKFYYSDDFQFTKGNSNININAQGILPKNKNTTYKDFENWKMNGGIILHNVDIKGFGLKNNLENINGEIIFDNEKVIYNNVSCKNNSTDLVFNGEMTNLLNYIFNKNSESKINLFGNVVSNNFDLNDWKTASKDTSSERSTFVDNLDCKNIKLEIGKAKLGDFQANNVAGVLNFNPQNLQVSYISLSSCGGNATGSFNWANLFSEKSVIQTKIKTKSVDITKLFNMFKDFGLEELKSDNISGSVNGDFIFASQIDNQGNINKSSIKAHADFSIEKGRLKNFKPMESLSNFINIDDLKDINFATISNKMDISNNIIYFPNMNIISNAIDLSFTGTHTLDNDIDYSCAIKLSDVLASKFGKKNPDKVKELVNDEKEFGKGKTKLFLNITGKLSKPLIKYDSRAVYEKLKTDMQNQKKETKQVLFNEFKWFSKDTTLKKENSEQTPKSKVQKQFQLEWDE